MVYSAWILGRQFRVPNSVLGEEGGLYSQPIIWYKVLHGTGHTCLICPKAFQKSPPKKVI